MGERSVGFNKALDRIAELEAERDRVRETAATQRRKKECAWAERDRLAAENAVHVAALELAGLTTDPEPRTRLMLAAYAFAEASIDPDSDIEVADAWFAYCAAREAVEGEE